MVPAVKESAWKLLIVAVPEVAFEAEVLVTNVAVTPVIGCVEGGFLKFRMFTWKLLEELVFYNVIYT